MVKQNTADVTAKSSVPQNLCFLNAEMVLRIKGLAGTNIYIYTHTYMYMCVCVTYIYKDKPRKYKLLSYSIHKKNRKVNIRISMPAIINLLTL